MVWINYVLKSRRIRLDRLDMVGKCRGVWNLGLGDIISIV